MSVPLSLGYSPCPNDTFIFYALVHDVVNTGELRFQKPLLEDVETLNRWAMQGKLDVTKLSCHALGHVLEDYCILSAGAALGRGCGPLLIARKETDVLHVRPKRIGIPGKYTTAALLLKMRLPGCEQLVEMRFDNIIPALLNDEIDAGVIIHESRFTYGQFGLHCLEDLGHWWEEVSGLPIPLGAIAARRNLGQATIEQLESVLQASVQFAFANPDACRPYIKTHSQELADEVVENHIQLYVNDYSLNLGDEGFKAIDEFLERGREAGALPGAACPLQW